MTSCVYACPLGLCVGVLSDKHSDPQRVDILRERLAFTEPPIKLVSDRRPRVGAGKARVLRWPPVRVPVGTRTCAVRVGLPVADHYPVLCLSKNT